MDVEKLELKCVSNKTYASAIELDIPVLWHIYIIYRLIMKKIQNSGHEGSSWLVVVVELLALK